MSPEEQAKVIELVEALIGADGVVTDEERKFLQRVIDRFRIPAEERPGGVVSGDLGRMTLTLRSFGRDDQIRVMALLVDAAVVDGCVAPEEHALLLASAATLGIDAAVLEERIARRLKSTGPGEPVSLSPPVPGVTSSR